MKNTRRKRWLTMLALVSMILPSAALEQRNFHSTDETKLLHGTLTNYDASKKLVTVRLKNGREKRFKISLLSEDDQKYVLGSQAALAINNGVRISFKEVKDKSTRTKEGLIRTSTVPTCYDITVYNSTKTPIEELELRYSYYYCIGTLESGGPRHTPHVDNGLLAFNKIYGQDTATLQTTKIDIVRASKKGVAPPAPSGGGGGGGGGWCAIDNGDINLPEFFDGRRKEMMLCSDKLPPGFSPGARRIDHVIGIAVEVVLNGKIIKTVANTPAVLKIHKDKKITQVANSDRTF